MHFYREHCRTRILRGTALANRFLLALRLSKYLSGHKPAKIRAFRPSHSRQPTPFGPKLGYTYRLSLIYSTPER